VVVYIIEYKRVSLSDILERVCMLDNVTSDLQIFREFHWDIGNSKEIRRLMATEHAL